MKNQQTEFTSKYISLLFDNNIQLFHYCIKGSKNLVLQKSIELNHLGYISSIIVTRLSVIFSLKLRVLVDPSKFTQLSDVLGFKTRLFDKVLPQDSSSRLRQCLTVTKDMNNHFLHNYTEPAAQLSSSFGLISVVFFLSMTCPQKSQAPIQSIAAFLLSTCCVVLRR